MASRVLVGLAVGYWLVRFFTGAPLADAHRLVLLTAWAALIMPLVVSGDALAQVRGRHRRVLARVHRAVVGHPWWTAATVLTTWLVSHALLSATLARTSYGYDLVFVVQAAHNAWSGPAPLWKTVEGSGSYFTHHFIPYLYLFWPLAQLPLAPAWFAAAQDVANAAFLGWAIVLIRGRVKSRLVQLALVIVVLANPFWTGVLHYEMHEYGLAPLLGLALWQSWERRSWWGWALACIGLLLLKETLAISLAWTGLVLLGWSVWRRHWFAGLAGGLALVLSFGALWLWLGWLLPHYGNPNDFRFSPYYDQLGHSLGEVALSPFLAPLAFVQAVCTDSNLRWLLIWLAALGGVGVVGWTWAVFLLPEIAIVVLAAMPTIKATIYQYGGPFLAPALLMLIDGGRWLEGRRRHRMALLTGLVAVAVAVSTWAVPDRLRWLAGPEGLPSIPFLLRLPPDVSAATNSAAGAMHSANRLELEVAFHLPNQPHDQPALDVDGRHAVYLVDERLPVRYSVPVREIDRCGPYRLLVPEAPAP